MNDAAYLREAIELGRRGMLERSGGPFGALIVREGQVLARACNEVTSRHDPTAHAEIQAIRAACTAVGDYRLAGAVIYCSCEPCPMCLGAIHWARLSRLVSAATRDDAASIGFDDALLYAQMALSPTERTLRPTMLLREEAVAMMREWHDLAQRIDY
jgi:tRNA(Arg) A34 adenosine deaminase TadA